MFATVLFMFSQLFELILFETQIAAFSFLIPETVYHIYPETSLICLSGEKLCFVECLYSFDVLVEGLHRSYFIENYDWYLHSQIDSITVPNSKKSINLEVDIIKPFQN